jgi:hypothetical protein
MTTWTSGYVSGIDYTYGYYRELSPTLMSLAVLNRGVRVKDNENLRYLELGFGQGLSLNIHAAACSGEFWGTDFNPSQVAHARELAALTGARVFDLSFAELAARDDLPEFDIIGLHGIWSWISNENRAAIVDLARRKLAVGGMMYISYNCIPGWSPAMPLRHLMMLHAELAGSDAQGIRSKIDEALIFAQKVIDSGALYFKANPAVAERLKQIQQQDRNYIAHEYFNRDWDPMPFSQVAEMLGAAKLDFAASTHLLGHVDEVNLGPEGQQLLASIAYPVLRESVRDYLVSQQFRKDVFVRGPRTMPPWEQLERYRNRLFVLSTPAADVPMRVPGPIGPSTLSEAIYRPLLEIMAENNHSPKSVKEILAHPRWGGQPLPMLNQCLTVLTGVAHLHPAQDPESIAAAQPRCRRLNAYFLQRARHGGEINYLASPVIGGGFAVNRLQQLFLLARQLHHIEPAEWAKFAWEILGRQGQRMMREGKALQTPEDNIAELTAQARNFAEKSLPILTALGIAE